MADFTIDVSRSKTSRINLGIQGENIIEHIIFDISGWIEEFGEGVAYIYAQRKGDENPYPVALDMDMDNGTATWTITDADTAIKGKGKAQLVFVSDDEDSITDVDVYSSSSTYSVGDYCLYGTQLYKCKTTIGTAEVWTPAHWDAVNEVKKTRVYATTVQASLVSTSSENPDAYETWLEVLGGYTAKIANIKNEIAAIKDSFLTWAQEEITSAIEARVHPFEYPVGDVKIGDDSIVDEQRTANIPIASADEYGTVSASYDDEHPEAGIGLTFTGASAEPVPTMQYTNNGYRIRPENLPPTAPMVEVTDEDWVVPQGESSYAMTFRASVYSTEMPKEKGFVNYTQIIQNPYVVWANGDGDPRGIPGTIDYIEEWWGEYDEYWDITAQISFDFSDQYTGAILNDGQVYFQTAEKLTTVEHGWYYVDE